MIWTTGDQPPGLSPNGVNLFLVADDYNWGVFSTNLARELFAKLNVGIPCAWINDSAILTTTAVVTVPTGSAMDLPGSGACVGRFPGGL